MTENEKFDYAYRYLWRKYKPRGAEGVSELKTLADEVFAEASETVTITGTSYEGGSANGSITFDKAILGRAIEKLLEALDPDYLPPPAATGIPVGRFPFNTRRQET